MKSDIERSKMTSERTKELLQADLEHVVHPFCVVGENLGIVFEKSHGIYLVDTEGKEYIDLSSQLVCCNLGHNCRAIVDAVIEALGNIDYVTSFYGATNTYAIELSQKLAKLTPAGLRYFLYTSGGSESVDSALKIARSYWYSKGQANKYKIISLYHGYHGLSGSSTYVTGLGAGAINNPFGPPPVGFVRVPSYYSYRSMFGDVPDSGMLSARLLESVIWEEGPDSIAAFIAEPIMGSAGCIEPPPEWWPTVMEICKRHNILLIIDEVMTGFARTGKMFASEHWDIRPDIMTMAKGISGTVIPFGAVAFSDEVYSAFKGKLFMHGFTYTGHPIGCAAAIAAIDYYVQEKLVEHAADLGKHIRQRLENEFLPLPCIGMVEGRGLFQAIELVEDKESRRPLRRDLREGLWHKLLENGIFTRLVGPRTNRIQICPPCVITREETDKALDVLLSLMAAIKPR